MSDLFRYERNAPPTAFSFHLHPLTKSTIIGVSHTMSRIRNKPLKPEERKTTVNVQAFCASYANSFNATLAAQEAGASANSSRTIGWRLLKRLDVQNKIEELTHGRNQKILLDGEEILGELKRIGDFDPRIIFGENGEVKDPKDWPIDLAKCISSIEVKEIKQPGTNRVIGHTKKIKFWDKIKALELLGKNKRLFIDRTEIDADIDVREAIATPEQVRETRKKFDEQY